MRTVLSIVACFATAMVHALSSGRTMAQALESAVHLASSQCTREGLELNDA